MIACISHIIIKDRETTGRYGEFQSFRRLEILKGDFWTKEFEILSQIVVVR